MKEHCLLCVQDNGASHSVKRDSSTAGKKDATKLTKKAGKSSLFLLFNRVYWSIVTICFSNIIQFLPLIMIIVEKGKTAKEEARELQLREEACVRDRVSSIQNTLSLMLKALGEMALSNPIFAHSQLPTLVSHLLVIYSVTLVIKLRIYLEVGPQLQVSTQSFLPHVYVLDQ